MIRTNRRSYKAQGDKIQRLREAGIKNMRQFIETYLMIRVKKPGAPIQPLVMNASQRIIWAHIRAQEQAQKPVRLIILKSRRVGASTVVASKIFAECFLRDNMYGVMTAHEREATTNMFRMQHLFLKHLPSDLQLPMKRTTKEELEWEPTNSIITLTTAGSKQSARSRTINWYQGSEVAFWPDFRIAKQGIEPAVSKEPGTGIIWESTAFGAGTDFHAEWNLACEGEIEYEPLFLKWFEDPDCMIPPFASNRDQDAYLEALFSKRPELNERMKHYGLTARQIGFWYEQLKSFSFDEPKTCSEFPCDPDEAFISTGTPVFPLKLLSDYRLMAKDGKLYDPLIPFATVAELKEATWLDRAKDTYLEVWIPPQKNRYYVISCDPAGGIDGRDFTSAFVLDMFTQSVVAELHGRIDPKKTAEILIPLAQSYNGAMIAPENDGLGMAVLSHLKDSYFNLYQHRRPDSFGWKLTGKLGWETTEQSRLEMIATARRFFQERFTDPEFIPSRSLLNEISTFVHSSLVSRKPLAERGMHDDRVMAWAIGIAVCLQELACSPNLANLQYSAGGGKQDWLEEKALKPKDIIEAFKHSDWGARGPSVPDGPFFAGGFDED